jgi:hypothetical protein
VGGELHNGVKCGKKDAIIRGLNKEILDRAKLNSCRDCDHIFQSATKGKRMITSLEMREEVNQGTNEIVGVKTSYMKIKKIQGG